MQERDTKTERDLEKAWKQLNENVIMPEASLSYDDGVRNAEVMGKSTPIETINGKISIIINSEKVQQLILRRIETSIGEMFYEYVVDKKTYLSEHDLTATIKKLIISAIPNITSYLEEVEDELEYATDFYNYLNDKIAELAEIHTPSIIEKYLKKAKEKNAK